MPSWDFQCDTCGHRINDVTAKISEYGDVTLKGAACQNLVEAPDESAPSFLTAVKPCPGHYDHTFTRPANFSFKGGAPTPKFFRG
jgi:hypothetical protein